MVQQREAIRLVSMNLERPLTPRILRAEHVRFVVVDNDLYARLGLKVPRPHRSFRLVARLGSTTIYRVRGPLADVEGSHGSSGCHCEHERPYACQT